MTATARRTDPTHGLGLPVLLLAGLGLVIGQQLELPSVLQPAAASALAPETVTIAPRPYSYRAPGEYLKAGVPTDGPRIDVAAPAPLEIMKYEVGAADYQRCVDEGFCHPAEPRRKVATTANMPAVGVSFDDAQDYAAWLSDKTGETWRLPSIAEWAFAAGSQAVDHALLKDTDAANPADRWLAFYEKEAALGAANASALPEPAGTYGENELGVADIGGTVWEWTTTCNGRTSLDAAGAEVSRVESCGVRFLEGRHRTPMSTFIRDGRSGGCSVGAPPDNLGFRLVREPQWYERLLQLVPRWG
jgi:formylglycine-generating enzyme required for sulfatase activity